MRFLIRHPLVILFIAGAIGLTYVVYDKAQQPVQGSGFPGGPGPNAAIPVAVEVVTRQIMADQVETVGTTFANESVNLTPKVSETVSKVHFQDGAFVEAGDVLVELTNAAEASRLAEAKAAADDAARQYERMRSLAENRMVPSTDADQAATNLATMEARLEGVLVAMDDRLVRAPFSGILGFRAVSEGSLVSPTTVITTLDDISIIKLDFTVPEIYLADVRTGQPVKARSIVYRNREFEGTIQVVGSRVDPVTRSVTVRAHIDNLDNTLRPGMLLTVSLALNEHEATVIPEQAVISSQGRHYAYVVDDENRARRVEVSLGRRRPGLVEILEGLNPGQVVITQGVAQVRPGQPVRVTNNLSSSLSNSRGSGMPGAGSNAGSAASAF